MPLETDKDRALALDPRYGGTRAVYVNANGVRKPVNVIFAYPDMASQVGEMSVENELPSITGLWSDFKNALHEEQIICSGAECGPYDGVTMYIKHVQPDGTGMCTIEISKSKVR